jgi:hypothetical protein
MITGSWVVPAVDGAEVRLRSGSISRTSVDITAPVRSGTMTIQASRVALDLIIALDRLRTGNFLTQAAARTLVTGNRAHDLVYEGVGVMDGSSASVCGQAKAGTLDVAMDLTVTLIGGDDPTAVALVGAASFGRTRIPLPGIGTVEDLRVDIEARLGLVEG